MGTYLKYTLHFSGAQIGLAYSTAAIASMISPFIVGMIADRYFSANRVLAFLNAVGVVLLCLLTQVKEFSLFFPLLLLYTICYMPTTALCNSVSMVNLANPTKEFSRIRLLGSIGWIAAGVLVSFLKIEALATPFYIAAIASALGILITLWLPYRAPERIAGIKWTQIIGIDAFRLIKDKPFAIIFIFSVLTCIPLAFYDSFTNVFLNSMQVQNAAAVMCSGQIVEIICLILFPLLFVKLRYKGSIGLSILIWTFLYGLLALSAYTNNTLWSYIALPLHGFCFTFFFVSGQLFVDEKAPANLRNSAQGLIAFATYGVGKYSGALISGQTVDLFTRDGVADWTSVWLIPMIFIFVVFVGFITLFKEKKVVSPVSE
ncbi:nucleoside permease [Porphyromonadaceae bacterium]